MPKPKQTPTLPTFGEVVPGEGGRLAGIMRGPVVDGVRQPDYALIVADATDAPAVLLPWGKSDQDVTGATSLTDGPTNTIAMAAAGSPAALQRMLEGNVKRATREATYMAVVDGIRAMPDNKVASLIAGDALREWMLGAVGDTIEEDDMAFMLGYKFEDGQDEIDALSMHIRACSGATLLRALAIYLALEDRWVGNEPTVLTAHAKALGINTAAIEKAAKAEVKADTAKKIKALQNQLKTTTTAVPTTPPEAPSEGEGGAQGKGKGAARNSKPNKITAAEAISGIADAMQSAEQTASAPIGAVAQSAADDTASAKGGYDTAVALVRKHNKASVSLVQRHLQVGYNAAARLLDQMEQAGVVTPIANDGTRQVIKAPATGFAEGQRVAVSTNKLALGPVSRFAGREGTVVKVLGDDTYQVKLDRGGSVPMFARQLQAAVGASA